jgi:HAD superfamily hydrolase (TIGR01484 family)
MGSYDGPLRLSSPQGLFITDLDGTLLTDNKSISVEDLLMLKRLQDRGNVTAIATGRSIFSFTKLVGEYYFPETKDLPVDYVIFSTGAGIMDYPACRILKSFSLPNRDVQKVCQYLDTLGADYMVQQPVPRTSHFQYQKNSGDNPDFERRIALYHQFATPLHSGDLEEFGDATEVLCIVGQQQAELMTLQLTKTFPRLSVVRATSPLDHQSAWIEIFSPEVSKSRAAIWLCDRLALNREQVAAVGNDYNDEDLLTWVEAGYITANAPESLRQKFIEVASNANNPITDAGGRWLTERRGEGERKEL